MVNFKDIKEYLCVENNILGKKFYLRDSATVAKDLLGKILIIGDPKSCCGGFIVESEAYYGANDAASHACNGITPRSKIMFEEPGFAYVYLCYGNHYLLNAVTEKPKVPGAVLIRAIEPFFNIEKMKERRRINDIKNLAKGPGNLTKALGINKNFNGKSLTGIDSGIFIAGFDVSALKAIKKINKALLEKLIEYAQPEDIVTSPRIGIKRAVEANLRFFIKGNLFVSGKK